MDYIIHERTFAMISADSNYYRTKVIEIDDVFYLREDPLTVIKNSCSHYGFALNAWNKLVKDILKRKSKLPVPILPTKGLFFVPTTSHRNEQCAWMSYYQIAHYMQKKNNLQIILDNGHIIHSNISLNQFKLQLKRTSVIIAYFYRLFHLQKLTDEKTVRQQLNNKLLEQLNDLSL